jgi:hypothetical protein
LSSALAELPPGGQAAPSPITSTLRNSYKVKHFNKYGSHIPSAMLPRDTILGKFDKAVHVQWIHIPFNTLISSASQESSSNGTFISDAGSSRRIAGSTKKAITSFSQLQNLQQMYCNALLPQHGRVASAIQGQSQSTYDVRSPFWIFLGNVDIQFPSRLRMEVGSLHIVEHNVKILALAARGDAHYQLQCL